MRKTDIIINIITQSLKVVLHRDNTLAGELLDLGSTVLFPIANVWVVSYSQGSAREDNSSNVVIMSSSSDCLLVCLWCSGLISQDETSANPDGAGTQHEGSSDGLSIVDTTSSNHLNGLTSHWASAALDKVHNRWDQNRRWNVTSVSTTLASLCADNVNTEVEALLNVLWVSDHVHVQNAGLVEALDNMFGRNSDGGDEKLSTRVDNNAGQLVELSLRIIVAGQESERQHLNCNQIEFQDLGASACDNVLGFSSAASNLREEQIDTKRSVLVRQVGL